MTTKAQALAQLLIRNLNTVPLKSDSREPLYAAASARLAEGTAARKLGTQLIVLPPGKRACPYHLHHAEEEMFVVLEGSGSLRVAGEMLPLVAGDTVFIPAGPEYPHQIINTSDAPLKYLAISTQAEIEVCEYPDSGKHGVWAGDGERLHFNTMQRKDPLDYWDGEP